MYFLLFFVYLQHDIQFNVRIMRFTILRIAILCTVLTQNMVLGQNAFKAGTHWESLTNMCYPPFDSYHIVTSLVDSDNTDNECLEVYLWNEYDPEVKKLIGRLRCDADKIYLQHANDIDKWVLMYDFGLQPGDDCFVSCVEFSGDGKYETFHLRCLERTISEKYGGLPCIKLGEIYDYNGKEIIDGEGVWILGIGSTRGLLDNAGFSLVGGNRHTLLRVTDANGETLCKLDEYSEAGLTSP